MEALEREEQENFQWYCYTGDLANLGDLGGSGVVVLGWQQTLGGASSLLIGSSVVLKGSKSVEM